MRVSQNSTYGTGSGSIYISVDYPSALGVGFRQILKECQWSYELVRRMCMGPWKETWDTDPTRTILSGSSMSVLHLNMDCR